MARIANVCYGSDLSGQTALPKPWPCCGWAVPPVSISGTWFCSATPGFYCSGLPTTPTAFTMNRQNDCGSVYTYSSVSLSFYVVITLSLCTEPTGAVVGSGFGMGIGPGTFTPAASGNGCSLVGGTYNVMFAGKLGSGPTEKTIVVNGVTF